MSELIKKQAAIDALGEEPEVWSGNDEYEQGLNNQWHYDVNALKNLPIVDAVPVVRCKDCRFLSIINREPLYAFCKKNNYIFHLWEKDTREHFCSWGERRKDEAD